MIIDNVWNLTRETFIIQLEPCNEETVTEFRQGLKELFPQKTFCITVKGGNENECN